jgi:uncharacterized protein YbjT (DUF2867 family)
MASSSTPTVFVCGATGSQGGALARELLKSGWNVRTITRDPETPNAKALADLGVHLVKGDWDNEEALAEGLRGCDKLYLCLLPNLMNLDEAPERTSRIVRLARAAGVTQAIASTTLGTALLEEGREPPIGPGEFFGGHLRSKARVERIVIDGGFDHWTVLRPAFFMANFLEPKLTWGYTEVRDKGSWTNCMTPEVKLGLVDHVDIGRVAAAAFRDPATFHGRKLGLTSQELPVQEVLDQLAEAIGDGRELKAIFMTDEEIKKAQDANSWIFFASEPTVRYMSDYVDLPELNKLVPGLMDFKTFLKREADGVKATYLADKAQLHVTTIN